MEKPLGVVNDKTQAGGGGFLTLLKTGQLDAASRDKSRGRSCREHLRAPQMDGGCVQDPRGEGPQYLDLRDTENRRPRNPGRWQVSNPTNYLPRDCSCSGEFREKLKLRVMARRGIPD